jgi:hypothetical protein
MVRGSGAAVVFQSGTSLVAQLPDSAITGGNARGANAVDWQMLRSSASQVASGAWSIIGGGANNQATSTYSLIAGGNANSANANSATVSGGQNNRADGVNSWCPGGFQASARASVGVGVWSSGFIASQGDAQSEEHLLRRQTTDATATRLTADNAVAGTTNTINLSNFSAIGGVLIVRARAAAGANLSAAWFINLSATRDANAASTLIEGGGGTAIAPTHSRGLGSAWRIDVTADTTNGGIAVTATGAAATTINWVARFSAAEVATTS